jgi:uncharacterized protein YkwD
MFDWLSHRFGYFARGCAFCARVIPRAVDFVGLVLLFAQSFVKGARSRKILFSLFFLCLAAPAQATSFPDVAMNHPNAAAIDYLTTEGVISGYPDGSFRPEQSVNRAEALKILLLASQIDAPAVSGDVFPDVPGQAWFARFVRTARDRTIVGGYPDGYFRPEQTVNLVEALKMLLTANAIELTNYKTESQLFADTSTKAWFNHFLAYAAEFKIVEPNAANQIQPAKPLTRGQLAELTYRFAMRVQRVCPQLLENAKTIQPDYFENVTLSEPLPNVFYESEIYPVRGQVAGAADSATVFFSDEAGQQVAFSGEITAGSFEVPVVFRRPGLYHLSVLPGASGRSFAASVEVLPRECAPATVAVPSDEPVAAQFLLRDNAPVFQFSNGANNLSRIVLRQADRRAEWLISGGLTEFHPEPADFADWQAAPATLQVFGARSENGYSFAPRTEWVAGPLQNIVLVQHHFSEWRQAELSLSALPTTRSPSITLSGSTQTALEPSAYLITPAGSVTEVGFVGDPAALPAGSSFTLNLALPETGAYILEINNTSGLAVLNHPLYEPGTVPLLPDFDDLRVASTDTATLSTSRERAIWLRLINDERALMGLNKLELDTELTDLAQNYAEKMARENFFGHVDSQGSDPEARRIAAGFPLPVGENLAEDSSTASAHAGLMRSAGHRANILDPDWSIVGLGIAIAQNGLYIFVQEFAAGLLDAVNLTQAKAELRAALDTNRASAGLPVLTMNASLTAVAQAWSEKMAAESFLASSTAGADLAANIRQTGFSGFVGMLLFSASSPADILTSLTGSGELNQAKTKGAVLGFTQASDGTFYATVIYF